MHVSVAQAVELWTEFERGYRGESSFGGNICEIYAYRLMPYLPGVHKGSPPEPGSLFYEDASRMSREAAESLRDLLVLFERHHPDCRVSVERREGFVPLQDWRDLFVHRVEVRFDVSGER